MLFKFKINALKWPLKRRSYSEEFILKILTPIFDQLFRQSN